MDLKHLGYYLLYNSMVSKLWLTSGKVKYFVYRYNPMIPIGV